MRMRQSLAEIERAFVEEAEETRLQRERVQLETARRARQRQLQRTHKRGTLRFSLLVLVLVLTAVLVTVAMFETLYLVMG